MPPEEAEERIALIERDLAALRSSIVRALALVQRRGTFVPDWRGALRILENWALRQAPVTHVPHPPK